MKLYRFEVSETPHLTVTCHSDLDISGGREGEVAIKAYGSEEDLEFQREDGAFTITSRARCKVGCPQDTVLTLETVHGDLRVRRVDGPINAKNVSGDAQFKEVGLTTVASASSDVRASAVNGDLKIDQVSGDLRVRSVNGDLQLGQVSGDLSIRDVKGALSCDNASGDFSARGIGGRLTCGQVSGDFDGAYLEGGLETAVSGNASLKTDFTPGCDYKLTASGNVAVKFPTNANAHFRVSASGNISHKVDWSEFSAGTGKTLDARVGDGEANVEITASGNVSLRTKADVEDFIFSFDTEGIEIDLELESMAEEIERNIEAQMERLNKQMERELGRIDGDAIQRQVQQAMDKARRKAQQAAERTRMKAERAQRRWQRMGVRPPARPTPPRPPREPVSDEERMSILRMVQEGKISADEAARLLEALEG